MVPSSPLLFEHIEVTNNTIDEGKWFFITNNTTYHQAVTFVNNKLPVLCHQFLSDTQQQQYYPCNPHPHRTNWPLSASRTYADALEKSLPSNRGSPSSTTTSAMSDTSSPQQLPPIFTRTNEFSSNNHNNTKSSNQKSPPPPDTRNNSHSSQDENSDFQTLQQQLNDITTKLNEHEDMINSATSQIQKQQDLISQFNILLETLMNQQQLIQGSLDQIVPQTPHKEGKTNRVLRQDSSTAHKNSTTNTNTRANTADTSISPPSHTISKEVSSNLHSP